MCSFSVPFEIVWAESDSNANGCVERFHLALLVQAHAKVGPHSRRSFVRPYRIGLRGPN